MTDLYILDDADQPEPCADLLRWAAWRTENVDRVVVAQDVLGEDLLVSTVFLGIDHQFGDGPPVLWETATLGPGGKGIVQQYHTLDEAREGHNRTLAAEMNKRAHGVRAELS